MPHISRQRVNKRIWDKVSDLFLEAVAGAKNKKEAEVFVTGFLTPTERVMLAKRFAVFFLLEKRVNFEEIKEILKVTPATISRVNLWRQTLTEQQRKFVHRILFKREVKHSLVDAIKEIHYSAPPPKGADWKEWGKRKHRWEMERQEALH